MHSFSLFFKGVGGEGFSIPDNTQKGVEISDVFLCHLKYKHYSKQKIFENLREGQLKTKVKSSIFNFFFLIHNVDQICMI